MVKNPSCNAADESLIPDQGTNIPHAALQLETLHCNEGSPVSLVLHQWKEIWVLWTLVYIYLFKSLLSGLLDVVSEVELISHGNSMFNFLGNYLAVFHSAELLYIFTSCAQRFQFFYILRTYCISFFFIHSKSHPNRFEVISH